MPPQCNGFCDRYCKNGVTTTGHRSLYDMGFVRCSVCRTSFNVKYTKVSSGGSKVCQCCGSRVRVKARANYRMVTPAIKVVQKL